MKIKWLIEAFHPDDRFDDLAAEVKRQGHECVVAKYLPFASGRYDVFPREACVLFQGSIQMAKQIQREQPWIPGVWCNWSELRCLVYYAKCGQFLLNQGYMMMPLAEVHRRRYEMLNLFGDAFFMRPDYCGKSFSGTLVTEDDFAIDSRDFSQWRWIMNEASAEDLVVVAPPKKIQREWRIVVAEGKALTSSLYKVNGTLTVEAGAPPEVEKLVEQIADVYHPDPMFIVDICESNNKLFLLEVGAFSVAGLYALDVEKIVETAARLAEREWKDIFFADSESGRT
jgi:hypothetical protein